MDYLTKPKIRHVTIVQKDVHEGLPIFIVQDSLQIIQARIPQILIPLVMLCDGQHNVTEIRAALLIEYNLDFSETEIENWLRQFDEAFLVEGGRFEEVKQQIVGQYRAAPFRRPALLGRSYPAQPKALKEMLDRYLNGSEVKEVSSNSRAIITPHIDYQRGGAVYAQVWASAAKAVRRAELIIFLATDHKGGLGSITLTPQNYASPLGIIATDRDLVNRLAKAIGTESAFANELNHVDEHSIELALVWLQHIRQEKPCTMVPILCGSFQHYMEGQADIKKETAFTAMIALLSEEMTRRRTLVVASGDLAHLGPAFNQPPLDQAAYEQMKVEDTALLDNICQGRPDDFLAFMQAGQYKRNVCGLPPFYFTLSLLKESRGQVISYDRCIADDNNSSFVSVGGIVLE